MRLIWILAVAAAVGCAGKPESTGNANASGESEYPPIKKSPFTPDATDVKRADVIEPKEPAKGGFPLRLKAQPGSSFQFQLTSDVTIDLEKKELPANVPAHQTVNISAAFTVRAAKVENGITDFEIASTPVTVLRDGKREGFSSAHATIRVDDRDRVVTAFNDPLAGMLGLGFVPFPQNPAAPGREWKVEGLRDVPGFKDMDSGLPKQIKMTEVYRLIAGKPNVGWTIRSSAKSEGSPVSSSGEYRYDSSGVLLSANVVQAAAMNVPLAAGGSAHGSIKVRVSLSRKSG